MEFFIKEKNWFAVLEVFLQPNLLHSRGGGKYLLHKQVKNVSWVFSGQRMGSCQEDTTCLIRHNLYIWINALYSFIFPPGKGGNCDGLRRSKPRAVNTKTPLFYFCRIFFYLIFTVFIQAIVTRCWFWDVGAGIAPSFPLPPLSWKRLSFMTLFHMIMFYISCFCGREKRWCSEGRVVSGFWVEQRLCSWRFSLAASPSLITYQNLKEFSGKMLLEVTVKTLTLSVWSDSSTEHITLQKHNFARFLLGENLKFQNIC